MRDRADVLRDLLEARRPIDELVRELSQHEWDCEQELVLLQPSHLASILDAYLTGSRTAAEVRSWAEAIECREDIGFDPAREDMLKDGIFELANPDISGALTHGVARELLDKLHR